MRKAVILAALLLATLVASPIAHAAVIFDTFGPGGTFSHVGIGIESFDGAAQEELLGFGPNFTLSGSTYLLDQITLPLVGGFSPGTGVILQLRNDAAGQPGPVVESFPITGITATARTFTVNSLLHPILVANQTYWLIGTIASANQNIGWTGFPSTTFGALAHGPYRDGHWSVVPNPLVAFSVTGTPVPEPSAGLPVLFGLICFSQRLRTTRRCCEAG